MATKLVTATATLWIIMFVAAPVAAQQRHHYHSEPNEQGRAVALRRDYLPRLSTDRDVNRRGE